MSLIALDISKLDISLCFLYLDLSSLWYFNVQPEKNPTYKERKKSFLLCYFMNNQEIVF